MKILLSAVLFSFLTSGCTKKAPMISEPTINQATNTPKTTGNFTYLALGDSYTIGESVKQAESFPYQLQALLKNQGIGIADPKIIAVTGWTTDELQAGIKKENLTGTFSFVTLLIGVNNQYRGYPINIYKKEFTELLQTAIVFAGGNKNKVFVVSIPDWGTTPFGKNSGRNQASIAAEIDSFNTANQEIASATGVSYTNITPASRNAATDPSLVASDGLHPSAKMYTEWATALLPKVTTVLK
ncbi:lysophospholipase L1-like esterase [Pedobacter sp. AK013]|uniref:SGNH/GDSL hydrolase family protein n=1 Tax=Pedobacter sp. AK013 TaxID=2723071 RepID=UPI00160804B6|nr:SGNH/GDSL hydrolase family protein [Pedobacter sp. AK013]MBB6236647.1 lysophospholipase L1-like esterase [Pedobacter sp. AK013]